MDDDEDTKPELVQRFSETLASFSFTPTQPRSPRKLKRESTDGDDALPVLSSPSRKSWGRKTRIEVKRETHASARATAKEELLCATSPEAAAKVNAKAAKGKRGYAPPENYAHLEPLNSYLKEELDILFCGINPGLMSATVGHHFANPTNHFWRCLHRSGLTPTDTGLPLLPSEDKTLPARFNLGLINLVARPSSEAAELAPAELAAGVPTLLRTLALTRPRVLCFVGRILWDAFARALPPDLRGTAGWDKGKGAQASGSRGRGVKARTGRAPKDAFVYDVQPYKVVHAVDGGPPPPWHAEGARVRETLFFVIPSTSGRVVSHQLTDKIQLCILLKKRLEEAKEGTLDTSKMRIVPVPSAGNSV
ncbi:DNA glycosylase [Wolfiporia cocos MD-104 SS10]|uniref:DNA glycosylase n=1 Tax=Wolfiporia cocos (strain MD-104) TaxID=742152 RepID=A0A2H3JR66_WOLCO|nr:DNA glycosylase [Wolfiporia cocos MD-104 SS10]